jgi:hypothetical protein
MVLKNLAVKLLCSTPSRKNRFENGLPDFGHPRKCALEAGTWLTWSRSIYCWLAMFRLLKEMNFLAPATGLP